MINTYHMAILLVRCSALLKLLVTVILLIVCASFWFIFLYRPLYSSIEAYTQSLTIVQNQEKEIELLEQNYKNIKKWQQKLDIIGLSDTKEALDYILNVAQRHQLSLLSCLPKEVLAEGNNSSVAIELSFRSSFHALYKFFQDITQASFGFSCQNVVIFRDNHQLVSCSMTVLILIKSEIR